MKNVRLDQQDLFPISEPLQRLRSRAERQVSCSFRRVDSSCSRLVQIHPLYITLLSNTVYNRHYRFRFNVDDWFLFTRCETHRHLGFLQRNILRMRTVTISPIFPDVWLIRAYDGKGWAASPCHHRQVPEKWSLVLREIKIIIKDCIDNVLIQSLAG